MGGGASVDKTKVGKTTFDFILIIGQGGFGKVHAAKISKKLQKKDPYWYAIKQMSKNEIVKKGQHGFDMLINELNILRKLNSPHLINAYCAFQDDNDCYIVMDLMLGGDVRYYLKRKKSGFDEDLAKYLTATFIISLEAVHAVKILHRDIKPDNMVIDANGHGRLTDFGIAQQLSEENNYVCTVGSGTLGYMAPEQASSSHEHSFPADWWQVGVVTYEFLMGSRPQPNSGPEKRLVDYIYSQSKKEEKDAELDEKYVMKKVVGQASDEAKDFVAQLLEPRPWCRLSGPENLMAHPWFNGFDWEGLKNKTFPAPLKPNMNQVNCDMGAENAEDMMGLAPKRAKLTDEQQSIFNSYDWNTDLGEEGPKNILNVLKQPVSDIPKV